jgi:hypothetical protein
MLAASRDEVIPREKYMIGAQKVILMIFFSVVNLITLNALLSSARFTQEYFMNDIIPDNIEARGRIFYRFGRRKFLSHGQFHVS